MDYLIAGSLSALIAWCCNVYLVKRGGDKAVVFLIPFTEEIFKTGISVLLGAPLVAAHLTFGLIEGVHDYISARRWGLWAGLTSIISHWFFGVITAVVYKKSAGWFLGVLAASLLHTLWNYVMVLLFSYFTKNHKKIQ